MLFFDLEVLRYCADQGLHGSFMNLLDVLMSLMLAPPDKCPSVVQTKPMCHSQACFPRLMALALRAAAPSEGLKGHPCFPAPASLLDPFPLLDMRSAYASCIAQTTRLHGALQMSPGLDLMADCPESGFWSFLLAPPPPPLGGFLHYQANIEPCTALLRL